MKKEGIKEIIFYGVILIVIIILIICNNVFWKIGKTDGIENNNTEVQNQTQYLQENNITYNVPFNEEWLD